MPVNIQISSLGNKFQDYRDGIPGDSYNFGPVIKTTDIQFFTFHHSVTKQTAKLDGNWKAECDFIANLHLQRPDYTGVGYRFIICSDGTVAYVGDLSRGGAAVADKNNIMFSACLVGDFTKELPTAAQIHSAHLLAKFFLTETPQYPNLDNWDDVKAHRDFMATTCPGDFWRVAGGLRERILGDIYQGYPNPQPTVITPPQPVPDPTIPLKEEIRLLKLSNATLTQKIVDLKDRLARIKGIAS